MDFDRFHQFSKFPIDIRLLIWQEALPGPRVITVEFEPIDVESDYLMESGYHGPNTTWDNPTVIQAQLEKYGFTSSRPQPPLPPQTGLWISGPKNRQQYDITSPTKTPSLRYVCRESANFMQSQGWVFALQTAKSSPIYINFALDTLYIWENTPFYYQGHHVTGAEPHHSPLSWFSPCDLQLVRKVAVYWCPNYLDQTGGRLPLRPLQFFNTLESCIRVIHDIEDSHQDIGLKIFGREITDFTEANRKPQLDPDYPKTHTGMVAFFHDQIRRLPRLDPTDDRPLIDLPRRMGFAAVVDGKTGRWAEDEVEVLFCPSQSGFRVDTWLTRPGDSCNCIPYRPYRNPETDYPWLRTLQFKKRPE